MDLEDAKKKLQFPDPLVQSRCISRLVQAIVKKKSTKQIDSQSPQIPELNLLWESCSNSCVSMSTLALDSIVTLALHNHLKLDYAITKLQNIITATRKASLLVCGLTKLLVQQAEKDEFPYSLQSSKHPFIVVLESVPEAWPVVLHSIMDTICGTDKSTHGFQAMEPVINYIIYNPCNSQGNHSLRNVFFAKLASLRREHPEEVLKYFCCIVPWLQISDADEVSSVMCVLKEIASLSQSNTNLKGVFGFLKLAVFSSLALTCNCISLGIDPYPVLTIAEAMSLQLIMNEEQLEIVDSSYVLISVLLRKTSGVTLLKLLKICSNLLDIHPPSPVISAMLIVPIVQFVSEPNIFPGDNSNEPSFLPSLLKRLESCMNSQNGNTCHENEKSTEMYFYETFSSVGSRALLVAKFASRLESLTSEDKMSWLCSLKTFINSCGHTTDFQFLLVAGLFLMKNSHKLLSNCLRLLEVMCEKTNLLSTSMFLLLIYKQSFETNPESLQLIVEYIPKTATHKYAVAPVLNVLQMMGGHKEMKPVVIYLMLELWKKQERCFPYLQKLLVEKDASVMANTGVCEVRIAQAAAIKELCLDSPDKHGSEFLQALSVIISESNNEAGTAAALLALDSIYHLCKSESLDLRSTWKILSSKLSRDKRPQITVRVCKLLSLAPQLQVKSFEYDKFLTEVTAYIWKMISLHASSPLIIGAAYSALSEYSMEYYKLTQLPAAAKVNLKLPPSLTTTPFEMAKPPEDVLTYIPGYCFVDLLKSMENASLEGYEQFLKSIIQQEVRDLPRGVYVQRKSIGKKNNPDDILSNVPGILCGHFQVPKAVAAQKNLAVGILLSYEPPVEFDKDGKRLKRSMATYVQLFEQILGILLKDVNLDCNEWQRCIILPQAWGAFMERAYFGSEEGRSSELELQQTHGRLKGSADEITMLFNTSWLWVRDRLLNLIKYGYQTSSITSANSIFAIAGLVRALEKFYAGLDEKSKKLSESNDQYLSHEEFQLMCTESIISVLDEQFTPSNKIHGWMLTPLSKHSSSTSALLKGSAAASLCHLLPIIKKYLPEKIPHLCKLLLQNLRGDSSITLSLFTGTGLGLFIQSLLQAGYCNHSMEQAKWLLEISMDLEETLNDEQPKYGNYVAIIIIIHSMCQTGNPVFIDWIKNTCNTFHDKLTTVTHASMIYEALSICTSCMKISAASAHIIPLSEVEELCSWFNDKVQNVPQCSSSAVSLGILLDSLLNLGCLKVEVSIQEITKTWISTIASQKEPTLHRVAALNGLCALFSSGRGLIKVSKNLSVGNKLRCLKDFTQLMVQFLKNPKESSLQNICFWELGRLYSVNVAQQHDSNIAPVSYSYLGEKSILKPLIQFLSESVQSDNDRGSHFRTALEVLSNDFGRPLPPLNWSAFLIPVVQNNNDPKMCEIVLKICIQQMSSSSTALGFLSSYVTPPVIHTLPGECHLFLLKNLPLLVSSLSVTTVDSFLSAMIPTELQDCSQKKLTVAIEAMVECQNLLDSNKGMCDTIENAFKRIVIGMCESPVTFKAHLTSFITFINKMSKESQNQLMQDLENSGSLCFVVMILCHMVKEGKRPISCLRPYIDLGKGASADTKKMIAGSVFDCLSYGENEQGKTESIVAFLMESIGWINVLSGSDAKYQLTNVNEVMMFLFDICLAILVGASGSRVCYTVWPETFISHQSLMQTLPCALLVLAKNPTWEENLEKIMDWLHKMEGKSCMREDDKYHISAALCALRGSKHFRKSTWCQMTVFPKMDI